MPPIDPPIDRKKPMEGEELLNLGGVFEIVDNKVVQKKGPKLKREADEKKADKEADKQAKLDAKAAEKAAADKTKLDTQATKEKSKSA